MLGKKSWNVYNVANIEKVKRDESAAATREADEERHMQEVDAERRIQLLRGVRAEPTLDDKARSKQTGNPSERDIEPGRERKRRRMNGENDTDRAMRLVKEHKTKVSRTQDEIAKINSDAPLIDLNGHINLFPIDNSRHHSLKNPEAEADATKKKKDYEDQYTLRFSNAAGLKQAIDQKPWYQDASIDVERDDKLPRKDVWGNHDPGRKERAKMRTAAEDPMAVMQKGIEGVRQAHGDKRKWREERDQEVAELMEKDRRMRKMESRHNSDGLDDFSLDTVGSDRAGMGSRHSRNHKSSRRHRTKDRGKSQGKHSNKDEVGWKVGLGGRYSNQFTYA